MTARSFWLWWRLLSGFFLRFAASVLVAAWVAPAASATDWSILFTAQDVRDCLSTPQGRALALNFCRRFGLEKVYLETFRDGYQADAEALRTARDFFHRAGMTVAGGVATTRLGKPSTGWDLVACYTDRANRERLASIFRFTASLFNDIIIDDFFFTDCECSECSAARGGSSWRDYRRRLMLDVSRGSVLAPARQVNPEVKIVLKYPQWYESFQERGYTVEKESPLYDGIFVGTETRDPSSDHWGHAEQYRGFFLFRWLTDLAGAKNDGGWFDPFGTDAAFYLDQAYVTVLAGAPEVFLFHYGVLASSAYQAQAEALASQRPSLDRLAKLTGSWQGVPAYKPPSSDPGKEAYIFDRLGMLAIPLLPVAHFPEGSRVAAFAEHALADPNFVPELRSFLNAGGTALVSERLAHRLNADPRLPGPATLDLQEGSDFKQIGVARGKIVVFSDALAGLAYVDGHNQVAQPTPELRAALANLRETVSQFTPTSFDAPPRVAIFPMRGRVAVDNFTELPVACHLDGMSGMASRLQLVWSSPGATLASDGATLRLPPHALIVVGQ